MQLKKARQALTDQLQYSLGFMMVLAVIGIALVTQPIQVLAQGPATGCGQAGVRPGGDIQCTINGNVLTTGFVICTNPATCCTSASLCATAPAEPIDPFAPPTNETFNALNPLRIAGGDSIDDTVASPYASELSNPGGIVSRVLSFAIPIAGLILFLMLVWGGFEMLVGAPSGESIKAGKQRVTAAIIGFLLLFSSYWLMQIIEVVFGVVIL